MLVISAVLFLGAASGASTHYTCPTTNEADWNTEVYLPHRECNKFYQCLHGEAIEIKCRDGLHFSIIKNMCDWRDFVECGDRIIIDDSKIESVEKTRESEVTPSVDPILNIVTMLTKKASKSHIIFYPNGCPTRPEINWSLPHQKLCNMFYVCVNGVRSIRRCPFWLHYNKRLQICDWPRNAECKVLS